LPRERTLALPSESEPVPRWRGEPRSPRSRVGLVFPRQTISSTDSIWRSYDQGLRSIPRHCHRMPSESMMKSSLCWASTSSHGTPISSGRSSTRQQSRSIIGDRSRQASIAAILMLTPRPDLVAQVQRSKHQIRIRFRLHSYPWSVCGHSVFMP